MFGEVKVLDFLPSWSGEVEEFDSIHLEDVSERDEPLLVCCT